LTDDDGGGDGDDDDNDCSLKSLCRHVDHHIPLD